jgi:DNA-binding NarL/FixJ family response regulator
MNNDAATVEADGATATVRLVIADDHRMLREGLKHSLADEGLNVVGEAADGVEAIERALELRPDVVLMDVTMPERNGIEATQEIRQLDPEIKVVMLTMHADADVLAAAVKAGASGYLLKDCSIEEIALAIHTTAAGETLMSSNVASSMLDELQRLDGTDEAEERVISQREEEVLQLIADGCSTPEVAERLYISQKTVKNHLASIYQKLEARDRTQAVLQAVRMGIVNLD